MGAGLDAQRSSLGQGSVATMTVSSALSLLATMASSVWSRFACGTESRTERPYAECRKGGGASSYNSDASKSLLLTEEVPHGRS